MNAEELRLILNQNKLKVICGECQANMIEAAQYKNLWVTDISFRCPNETCSCRLSGVRLRYEESKEAEG